MVQPAAVPAPDGVKGAVQVQEPNRAERAIARRGAEARATIPDVELTVDADIPDSAARSAGEPAAIVAIVAQACARALREVPRANGAYRDGHFELYSRVNVGVTVVADELYVIPTVFDADRKSLAQLRREIAELARRAGAGELSPPELGGATFTLSNPGALGVAGSTPVIIPPQAAALAAGAIRPVPVSRDGALVPGHVMTLTLACDHRILYGAPAARFLIAVKKGVEEAAR